MTFLASLQSGIAKLVDDFKRVEPVIANAVARAEPTVEAALGAIASVYSPRLAGAAQFAVGLARILPAYLGTMATIKAASPDVPPEVWAGIADHNIAADAAIMALQMPAT